MQSPLPPFDAWPLQVREPGLGFAWYASPCVFVSQPLGPHGTLGQAAWIHDLIDAVLAADAEAVVAAGGLFVVHDWRQLKTYDREARKHFMERMKERKRGYLRGAVAVVPPSASALLKMAIEGANLFASVALGRKIEVSQNIGDVVERLGLVRPRVGAPFPGVK